MPRGHGQNLLKVFFVAQVDLEVDQRRMLPRYGR